MSNEQIKVKDVETTSLKGLSLDEKWLKDKIEADPKILGLAGNVICIDREIQQPTGGILDLLLEDEDTKRRYEVEIQLGALDESHIVRAIEYWDVERRKDSDCEHYAVIVAEEITGRFFNVIEVLHKHMPLIAIKLTTIKYSSNEIGLLFTRILGVSNEESSQETWIKKRGESWMNYALQLFEAFKPESAETEPHYTKDYIAMQKSGENVLLLKHSGNDVRVEILGYPAPNSELKEQLESAGVEPTHYPRYRHYRFFVPIKTDLTQSKLPAAMERILEGNNLGEQEQE